MRAQSGRVRRMGRRLAVGAAVASTVGLFLPLASAGAASAAPATPGHALSATSTGGAYIPVPPTRVTDTRLNSGFPGAGHTLGPAGTVTVNVGVPATATAVALSVTAVDATAAGFLSVFPGPTAGGATESVLNFVAGPPNCTTPDCVVPNLVVSQVTGGQVTVKNTNANGGNVDVIVDVEGYFDPTHATTSGSGHYTAASPHRVLDTRCATSPPSFCAGENLLAGNAGKGTLNSGGTVNVATGLSGASAAVVQLTATDTSANGFLTAFGSGTRPTASNVNFVAGQTTSNRAIVPLAADGSFNIFNFNGTADVVVDVVGSFSDASGSPAAGSLFTPVSPTRLVDTRTNGGGPLGPGQSGPLQVAGAAGIPAEVNGSPTAAALNVTEATATAAGFLTVTPNPLTPPATTSDVNFSAGEIRANADLATLSPTGGISVYNYTGMTNVAVDAFGYFAAAAPAQTLTVTVSPTSGVPGTTVTGTVTSPAGLTSITVNGCGLTNQSETVASNNTFSFAIPAGTATGACNLTFTATSGGQTITSAATAFTVTAPTGNTAFSVTPGPGTVNTTPPGVDQLNSATGLDTTKTYTIELFACANVHNGTGSTAGTYTFTGSNPGGAGNVAQPGTIADESITVVNSTATAGGTIIKNVIPAGTGANGVINFTVHNNGTPECVTPVIFQDAGTGILNLGTNNQPTVPFGVGGPTTFVVPASPGSFGGGGGSVEPNGVVTADSPTTFTSGGLTYTEKSGDTYSIYNSTVGTCQASTFAAFQAALTVGDRVGGNYQPTATSTFCLDDITPFPPQPVTVTPNDSTQPAGNTATGAKQGGLTVSFTDVSDANVTGYNVYRAQAPTPTIVGAPYVCPTYTPTPGSPQNPPPSSYTLAGTVTAPTTPPRGTATLYFNDTSVTATAAGSTNRYCYVVSSVAPNAGGSAQVGTGAVATPAPTAAGPTPAVAPGAATAPTFDAATKVLDNQTVQVIYNQAINPVTVDPNGSDFTASYGTGPAPAMQTADVVSAASSTNTGTTMGGMTMVGSVTITLATPVPAGQVVTITAKNGADTNTVCSNGSTTVCQTAGQQVVTNNASNGVAAPPALIGAAEASPTAVTVTFNQPVCRSAPFAPNDFQEYDFSAGTFTTVSGDTIPICNGTATNGVATALVTTGVDTNGHIYGIFVSGTSNIRSQSGQTVPATGTIFQATS